MYENNEQINRLRKNIETEKWKVFEAKKTSYPSLAFELSDTITNTLNSSLTATPQEDHEPFAKIIMNAPLSFNGQITKGIILRKKELELARLLFESTKEKKKLELFSYYLDALKNYRLYTISKEILSRAEKLITIFENTYELGQINRLDYVDAVKETGKLKYKAMIAERKFYNSFYNLAIECGFLVKEPEDLEDIPVDMDIIPDYNVDIIKSQKLLKEFQSIKIEKDIYSLKHSLTLPEEKLYMNFEYNRGGTFDSSKGEFSYPLNKSGYKYSLIYEKPLNWHSVKLSRDYEEIGRKPNSSYLEDTVLITDKIRFDLFERGVDRSQITQSEIEKEVLEIRYNQYKKELEIELKKSIRNLINSRHQILSQQKTVSLYEEKLKIEEEKFRIGKFLMPELLEHHVESLLETEKYIEASFQYKSDFIYYKYITGVIDDISF